MSHPQVPPSSGESLSLFDEAIDAASDPDCDFSVDNIPFGVGKIRYDKVPQQQPSSPSRCLAAIGDSALDLSRLQEAGLFDDIVGLDQKVFSESTLNNFMEHSSHIWLQVRRRLQEILGRHFATDESNDKDPSKYSMFLRSNPMLQRAVIHKLSNVDMQLPADIQDYTDFYSSREHATNVGTMFRGPDNALQPNWLHLPVGYHGRSSTIICSDHPVVRPCGQIQLDPNDPTKGSVYGPCKLLDFELEVAFFVGGKSNPLGQPITMTAAKDRIFGYCLVNDWSARDIQKWEYVPLGPFTSKNFATSISPWVVSTHALEEAFRASTSALEQTDPVPLEYLQDSNYSSYDINLTVSIQPEKDRLENDVGTSRYVVCRSNYRNLYWNAAQQLVHHSVTGCIMNPGDLLASGTISGQTEDSFGSMLELSWRGSRDVLVGHTTRKFLQDGDTVIMKGFCNKEGHGRVGFGSCKGKILPAGSKILSILPCIDDRPRYNCLKLYGLWKSSSSWRVRIALQAKAVQYEAISVNILAGENKEEWYLQKNPLGQIPVLEYTDTVTNETKCISQSVAVIEFLEHAFPKSKPIFPLDPYERIIATEILEIINSGTQPLQNLGLISAIKKMSKEENDVDAFRQDAVRKGLVAVESRLRTIKRETSGVNNINCGPYAMGGFAPNVVDMYLIPQLYNARASGIIVEKEFPILSAVEKTCEVHPWFIKAHPSLQPDAP
jgi:fumarylacetoacetase